MGTLVAFIVVSASIPVIRKKGIGHGVQGFRVPFGPYLIPALSIFACLYILKDLSGTTFKVFFIWMFIAISIYFAYSKRHSALNK
jgi:APA family basic amino acid/polyamine antiporter